MDARGEVSGSIGLLQDTAHSGERGDGGVEKETPRKLSSDRYRFVTEACFMSIAAKGTLLIYGSALCFDDQWTIACELELRVAACGYS